jgi:hypothetical protein
MELPMLEQLESDQYSTKAALLGQMTLSALGEALSHWGRWLVNQYIRVSSFGSYPNNVQARRYIY